VLETPGDDIFDRHGIDERCATTRLKPAEVRVGTQRSLRVANRPERPGAEPSDEFIRRSKERFRPDPRR
jgi:hypothetical protein